MKNIFLLTLTLFTLTFTSCQKKGNKAQPIKTHKSSQLNVQNVDVIGFNNEILKNDAILVDVRTPAEYAKGHIPNAINIDWENPSYFNSNINKLAKNKPVLIYCRSGHRSGLARDAMKKMGFTSIYNLNHGILSWNAAKMPIEK